LRGYELTLVLNPGIEEDGVAGILDKIGTVVAKGNGKVAEIDRWGVRKLAYPISNMEEGYYLFVRLEGDPGIVDELDSLFKLSSEVLRFMMVRGG
jgi:small subunit ribosomal protein S6